MTSSDFTNVYDDSVRADAYDKLEFPATYYLAYRDLPTLLSTHVRGRRALDFGCGAGRSTRFLQGLGFATVGVDISGHMLARARSRDPEGDYRLLPDGDLSSLAGERFDLVLSSFTFDNVPSTQGKTGLFRALGELLTEDGRFVNIVSAPEIYVHEWASFSTRDFPDNWHARSGERVHIVMLDVDDRRPVEDIFFTDDAYQEAYRRAGLEVTAIHRPLGDPGEPYPWVSETKISPWAIYVVRRDRGSAA